MKVIVPPPTPVYRDYRHGGEDGLRVTIPDASLTAVEHTVDAWLYALISPNGTDTSAAISISGANEVTVDNATAILAQCENDALETLHYLRVRARRRSGSTGAIAAQTIRLLCSPVRACTVDNTTEIITATGHGLSEGQLVWFEATVLPTGLTAITNYYVRDVTANSFKVSATLGGSAVNITSNGTAVFYNPINLELGRLRVLAAAAGADPVTDYIEQSFSEGSQLWSCGGSSGVLSVEFESSDIDLELEIEAAGEA